MLSAARAAASPAIERKPLGASDWMPLAHADAPEASQVFPANQLLTAERLSKMAQNYDPRRARAPIIRTSSGRLQDAHDAAEGKSQAKVQVLGFVNDLKWDGQTLHYQPHEIADRCTACSGSDSDCTACQGSGYVGRLQKANTEGHVKRSIHSYVAHPQFGGEPYLRDVAVGWDHEGQNWLPPANHHLPGLTPAAARSLVADFEGAEFACRSIPDPPAAAEEPVPMDEKKMEEMLASTARSIAASNEAAIKAATDPLAAQLAEQKLAVTAAQEKAAAAETASRALAETAAQTALEARIDKASDLFKPADRALIVSTARALAAEPREAYLKDIEGRQPILSASRSSRHYPALEAAAAENIETDFGPAADLGPGFDPADAERWESAARSLRASNGGRAPDAAAIMAQYIAENPTPPWMRPN